MWNNEPENEKQNQHFSPKILIYVVSFSISTLLLFLISLIFFKAFNQDLTKQCLENENNQMIILVNNLLETKTGTLQKNQVNCYDFALENKTNLKIQSSIPMLIITPKQEKIEINSQFEGLLSEVGKYTIILQTKEEKKDYQFSFMAKDQVTISDTNQINEAKYNVINPPYLIHDQQLQTIVNKIVKEANQRNLPTNVLSISLINLNSNNNQCCGYGFYQDYQPRYPASIVKLFWLTALFGRYEAGEIAPNLIPEKILIKMIQDSDNEAASEVLDVVTETNSGKELPPEKIKDWKFKREFVNRFFLNAGYTNHNISQKTFPIPYLKLNEPEGRDLQIRSENLKIDQSLENPIRNYTTTYNLARLLYEIRSDLAISKNYSDRIDQLLNRDLNPLVWKKIPFNAIEGFLGEYLPTDTIFSSKMGWTFNSRNDGAIIASPDGKIHYILVVFGDDAKYYEDKTFLPEISKFVYEEMSKLSK